MPHADLYTPYETGLQTLLERLGSQHPRYAEVLIYQQRLGENLAATRAHGDNENRRSERSEMLAQLDRVCRQALAVPFTSLCPRPTVSQPPAGGAPVYNINTDGGAVVLGDVDVSHGNFVGRSIHTRAVPHPPQPKEPPATRVDTAHLRRHLRRLDDVALDALCLDHFPEVYDQFGRGLRRDEKVNLLLAHCRRNPQEAERLEKLLVL